MTQDLQQDEVKYGKLDIKGPIAQAVAIAIIFAIVAYGITMLAKALK